MRTIIAGSRNVTSVEQVLDAINAAPWEITEVVSGMARGVDSIGADLGRRAGYLRNEAMADYAEALIAVWDGTSRGTKHMIDIATQRGMTVFVYRV